MNAAEELRRLREKTCKKPTDNCNYQSAGGKIWVNFRLYCNKNRRITQMDEELQKVTNELCDLLRPVNIKLEKWIVENKKGLIASDGKLTELGLLVGNAYAVYILIDDLLNNAD